MNSMINQRKTVVDDLITTPDLSAPNLNINHIMTSQTSVDGANKTSSSDSNVSENHLFVIHLFFLITLELILRIVRDQIHILHAQILSNHKQ